jgi:O-antigen/teichoic acid export membrane protein
MGQGAAAPPGEDALVAGAAGPAVIRGGAIRSLGYAASVVLGLAAAPFLIRELGVREYGRYVTILSIVAVIQGFSDAGLTNLGVREYATRDRAGRDRLMRHLVGIRIMLATTGAAIVLAFVLVADYDRTFVAGALIAAVGAFLLSLQATLSVPLLARLRLGLVTLLDVLRQGASFVLIIIAVLAGLGLLGFLGIGIVVGALVAVATAGLVIRTDSLRPAYDRGEWRQLLRDTAPIALAGAAFVLYYRIAVVVMSLVATEAQTGYFSVSYRVIEALATLPSLLIISAFPVVARAAEEDEARLRYVLQRLFEVAVIGGVWLALMTVIGAPLAVKLLAGDDFDASIAVLQIQGVSLAATFLLFTWGFALLALRRNRALIVTNVGGLLLALVSTTILASLYGAKGAAAGMVLTEFALAVGYGGFLVQTRSLRPSLGIVPRVGLAVALAAGLVLVIDLPTVGALVLGSVVFAVVLALVRGFPSELGAAFAGGRD